MAELEKVIEQIKDLKSKKVVWMSVVNFLGAFIDTEAGSARKAITDDSIGTVSQDVINQVISHIEDSNVGPLQGMIDSLSKINVELPNFEETEDVKKSVGSKEPEKKKEAVKKPPAKQGKKIRRPRKKSVNT